MAKGLGFYMGAIGFAFGVLAFLVVLAHFTLMVLLPPMWPVEFLLFPVWLILSVAVLAIGGIGLSIAASEDPARAKTGYVLLILYSIVAFPVFWGFIVGSILTFVGGIVGLVES
ncbi:MAG: hypothetical protein ACP5G6_06860 [Conexivisphaera sp.]|nr:hypothetical protein [Conexivisphaerales archaeon]